MRQLGEQAPFWKHGGENVILAGKIRVSYKQELYNPSLTLNTMFTRRQKTGQRAFQGAKTLWSAIKRKPRQRVWIVGHVRNENQNLSKRGLAPGQAI